MVFAPFRCENRYRFCSFWSGIGYGFRGNYRSVWKYSSFQFQMNHKERVISEFEMDFKKSFCLSPTLKMMTSFLHIYQVWNGYGFKRPGLKTGVENYIFQSDHKGSGYGEPGRTPAPKIPRGIRTFTPGVWTFRPLTMIHDYWYALLTISPW